jgi:thiol-disulfide isomerase/thioredoxin
MVWVTLTGSDGAEPDRLNNAIAQPGGGTALIGQPLPTVTLAGIDGGTITLGPDLQRPTVINFWASWCPPCVREMPEFEQVYLERDGAVDFVGVNVRDNVVTAQQLAERTGVTYPLVLDGNGEMARTFAVVNMPTTVFVAADGTVTDIHAGALDAASVVLLHGVTQALSGLHCQLRGVARQRDEELLAAPAHHHVALAQVGQALL